MLHTLALSLLRGMTQAQTLELLRHVPDARAIFERPDDVLTEVHPTMRRRIETALQSHGSEALARAACELEFCERHNIRALGLHHSDYPQRLAECPDAPAMVFYRGNADLNAQHVLAVVGTRRITPYGKDLCQSLCADLRRLLPDVLVVSGLAYGVDIHAHRGCLKEGLSTVGILAHGLDQIYPSSHRETAKAMLRQGGLLTEYISQTRAHAGNFVRRNRIVAGMADATLVVESAQKGGALITARLSMDYDRLVCAFPGRTADPYSEGCNRLIRDRQAELVTSAYDLLDLLNWNTPAASTQREPELNFLPTLTPEQQAVVEALKGKDGLNLTQLCIKTNMEQSTMTALLFELEMSGIVRLMAGGLYRLLPQ